MKKTLFKLMGLALTIAMLASLILGVIPVGASSVSVPTVTVSPSTISALGTYKIGFQTTPFAPLDYGDVAYITITFPAGTSVPDGISTDNVWLANSTTSSTFAYTDYANASGVDTDGYAAGIVKVYVPSGWADVVGNISVIIGVDGAYGGDAVIGNPVAAGSYTLTVSTSADTTAVTSSSYSIGTVGQIMVYNSAGGYLGTFASLSDAAGTIVDYSSVKIAPGAYVALGFNFNDANHVTVTTTGQGVVIISAFPGAFNISGDYNSVTGVVFVGSINVNGDYATLTGCVFSKTTLTASSTPHPETLLTVDGDNFTMTGGAVDTSSPSGFRDIGVHIDASNATISGVAFKTDQDETLNEDHAVDINSNSYTGILIKNCTFTGVNGGCGILDDGSETTIKDNTFTGLQYAIWVEHAEFDHIITGNTITGSITNGTDYQPAIYYYSCCGDALIASNTIKDNTGYSILVSSIDGNYIDVVGNNFSNNAKGLKNTDTEETLYAVLNWWGAASGPTDAVGNPAGTGDKVTGLVNYQPFLSVTSTVCGAFGVNTDTVFSTLPMSQTFGFGVLNFHTMNIDGAIIIGQKLSGNPAPVAPPFPAVAYFDIFTSSASDTPVQINLYATGLTNAYNIYMWNGGTQSWVLVPGAISGTGTYVYCTVDGAALTGTAFAIVQGLPPAPPSFAVGAPAAGATTALNNVPFTWTPVVGATKYSIAISVFGDMSKPDVDKYVNGTAYAATNTFVAGTPYFWQVTAWQGDTVIGKSVVGTFTPQAPPSTTTTPQITITTQPAPTITFTQPASTVITIPPVKVTQITPAWIWGIIGVGAVLVIVVIVLIVRTRRSA